MTFVFSASIAASPLFSDLPALLRRGLFMVVSAFSTTGFQVITTNELTTVLTSGAFLSLALVMAVGGGAGSTSGGIKLYRVGIIFKSIVVTIKGPRPRLGAWWSPTAMWGVASSRPSWRRRP